MLESYIHVTSEYIHIPQKKHTTKYTSPPPPLPLYLTQTTDVYTVPIRGYYTVLYSGFQDGRPADG